MKSKAEALAEMEASETKLAAMKEESMNLMGLNDREPSDEHQAAWVAAAKAAKAYEATHRALVNDIRAALAAGQIA